MPDQMMHLAIANKLITKLEISDEGAFYLGSISPDAIHARKDSTRAEKSAYHFHADTKEEWIKNASDFIELYLSEQSNDFYKGYASHILTDIVWAYGPFKAFKIYHSADSSPSLPVDKAYYYDLRRIDYKVYQSVSDIQSILSKLEGSEAFAIQAGPDIEEIYEWKNRVIERYTANVTGFDTPPVYLKMDEIYDFFDDACDICVCYLK